MRLYKDFSSDTGITWALNAAVSSPKGPCIEEANCNWELATVCAFHNSTTANQVSFLACMDESKSEEERVTMARRLLGGGGGNPLEVAKKCATGSQVDVAALGACYAGAEGQSLLEAAAAVFSKSNVHSVPHTLVNTKNVNPEYAQLKAALCSAGSTATVCKSKFTKCAI